MSIQKTYLLGNSWWPHASTGCAWGYTSCRTFPYHWYSRTLLSWWDVTSRIGLYLVVQYLELVGLWRLSLADQWEPNSSLANCQLPTDGMFCHRDIRLSCASVVFSYIQDRMSDHKAKIEAFCHYGCMVWSRYRTRIWNPFFLKTYRYSQSLIFLILILIYFTSNN